MQRYVAPGGEEFEVEELATARILNEGLPFIIIDIKEKRLSIKEGDLFLYTDRQGVIRPGNTSGLGLYLGDTRFLSCWEIKLNGRDPVPLSTSAERDYMAHIELTNADLSEDGKLLAPQETINIRRLRVIGPTLMERIRIKNYNPVDIELTLSFAFAADFADIFEVRGLRRTSRGKLFHPKVSEKQIVFAYLGKDEIFRRLRVTSSEAMESSTVTDHIVTVNYRLNLKARSRSVLHFNFEPLIGEQEPEPGNFNVTITKLRRAYDDWEKSCTSIVTDNELFNSVLERGAGDLRALVTKSDYGTVIAAGIPWYVAPFGRDSLIAGLETMFLNPEPVRSTLEVLARLQGREVDPWRDEEPGKIMHELRRGELAGLNEIPHTPYYGSIDSTPLYLLILSEYHKWTADSAFVTSQLDNVKAALAWVDDYGDVDGDGFVEYLRKSKKGLINQGWKDSHDAISHADGELAEGYIALVEVQAYVYYAKRRTAGLFQELGLAAEAAELLRQAAELKERFNAAFWMPAEEYFAVALDGEKRQMRSITSNPGQCLWSGIVDDDKAEKIVAHLMSPDMFSGWGLRTLSKSAQRYNPMSYHNGSVWPHDNAIIVRGLKRYGYDDQAARVVTGMFDAAIHHAYYRLPELFCGFTRRGGAWPVDYPVACSPQAWAAGATHMMLQTILGLTPDAAAGTLYINNPRLPPWLNTVRIANLKLGEGTLDLEFNRHGEVTSFTASRKSAGIRIVMEE